VIIREIQATKGAHVAYFYFDEKQDSRTLLSSLLLRLSNQSDQFCGVLRELYSKHQDGNESPHIDSLVQCLKDMLSIAGQGPIYLVLDALDECPDSGMPPPRDKVLELVKELVKLRQPNLRLCVTSRPEDDIRAVLKHLKPQQVSLHDESGQTKDIIHYIRSKVQQMKKWTVEDQDMVIEELVEKADGM
jgi:ATP/maltotriose-dependent transcriptional regulator MalT